MYWRVKYTGAHRAPHAAMNASLTPPATGDPMQPTGTAPPAGSEETVQSAQQVQTATVPGSSAQQGYVTAATLLQDTSPAGEPTTSRERFHIALYGDSVQAGTSQTHGTSPFPSVHQAQAPA